MSPLPLRLPSLVTRTLLLLCLAAVGAGCDSLSASGETTFTGLVLDEATSAPLAGVAVAVEGTSAVDTTGADGRYDVAVSADSSGQGFVLVYTAPGFEAETATAAADVDDVVTVSVVRLAATGETSAPSGPATSVTLDSRSTEVVGVSGAGAVETATLTFLALDGRGQPVSADQAVDLTFEIASGPDGGETISPESAQTGPDGRAEVTLTSGTRSGTVQVLASGTVDGREVRSLPVTITITGGLPDDAHFSIAPAQLNFAGYNRFGLTNEVTAFVGDKYGNPVQPGTAVYFTTDGGLIGGSGVTGPNGTTTVELLSAAPLPANALACSSDPRGYATVTARTADEDRTGIEAEATVLFSGVTQIELQTAVSISGPTTSSWTITFGHPLAPGTSISVEADGVNVRAAGDVAVTLGDYLCPGPGQTTFRFSVTAADPESEEAPVLETITITVTSPNGNARLTRSSLGRQRTAGDVFERLD